MAGSKISWSYEEFGRFLKSEEMETDMKTIAEKAMEIGVEIAPVGDPARGDRHPGEYKASFEVSSTRDGGVRGDRAEGTLSNRAGHALQVEYGTSRQAGYHTLLEAMTRAASS
jgi:hypothetical protein